MRKKRRKLSQRTLMHSCAWCHRRIKSNQEVFGVGGKAKPDVDLSDAEGTFISMLLVNSGKKVYAMVTTSDSPAKADGNDLCFMICSEDCGLSLTEALRMEIDTIDHLNMW